MAEFVSFDPNAEVGAGIVFAVMESHRLLSVDIEHFVKKHHLTELKLDDWINLQAFLDFLKDIQKNSGNYYSLISVGSKIPGLAKRPPNINSVESILLTIDDGYHLNHRNGDIGEYTAELVAEHHIRITARVPYPSDLDYGIFWGAAREFTKMPKIVRAESPSRLKGDDRCIYDITW